MPSRASCWMPIACKYSTTLGRKTPVSTPKQIKSEPNNKISTFSMTDRFRRRRWRRGKKRRRGRRSSRWSSSACHTKAPLADSQKPSPPNLLRAHADDVMTEWSKSWWRINCSTTLTLHSVDFANRALPLCKSAVTSTVTRAKGCALEMPTLRRRLRCV